MTTSRHVRRLLAAAAVLTVIPVVAPPAASAGAAAGAVAAPRLTLVAAAAAAPAARFSVQPAPDAKGTRRIWFQGSVAPGKLVRDAVVVENLDLTPITVKLYATDGFTSSEGAFTLLTEAQAPREVGAWIGMKPHAIGLKGKQKLTVPYQIRVPANATPGDHAGGIVASVLTTETNPNGQQVQVDRRVGSRVYLRVDGPIRPGITVSVAETSYEQPAALIGGGTTTINYRIKNSGNSRVLRGNGRVEVSGPLGIRLGELSLGDLPEVLPGSEVIRTAKVKGIWPAGAMQASATTNAVTAEGQLPATNQSAAFWAMPWFLIILLAAVLAVLGIRYLLAWLRRRRAAAPGAGPDANDPLPAVG